MITVLSIVFTILMLIGMPISFALGIGTVAGMIYHGEFDLILVIQRMFIAIDSFSLMAIPFFMLAGSLMEVSGISRRIVDFANVFVGWMRGGLAMVAVLASMIFSCVCGSAVATTAAVGSVLIPPMEEKKYGRAYSASVIASAGVIGAVFPPSIPMIIYGSMTGCSIGALFVAGYIPGVLVGIGIMLVAYYFAKKHDYPPSPVASLKLALHYILDGVLALIMPFIIVGGILMGIFTPTESGAVACIYALVVGGLIYRELSFKSLCKAVRESMVITTMILFLIAVASIFGWLITAENIPQYLCELMLEFSSNKWVILLILNIFLLLLGTFMDFIPAVVLVVPVLLPLLEKADINLIHFGIILIVNNGIGLLTPPVGTTLFVAMRLARVGMVEICKEVWPHMLVMTIVLLILTYIPITVMWLPDLLYPG